MEIIVAGKAGFCSGVNRAVSFLLDNAEKYGAGVTLGPLVHNEEVISYLSDHGVDVVELPEEAHGAFIAIRTHGVTPEILKKLETMSTPRMIDLTCPRVRKVQKLAEDYHKKGYKIIVFGNRNHPEVIGIVGWSGGTAEVITHPDDLENIEKQNGIVLISQTTGNKELFEKVIESFMNKFPEGAVYNTLCPETGLRQEEVTELARRVEALIVVGSKMSANTKALYDKCRQLKPACRIANAGELKNSFLKGYNRFGVVAGASTPSWTIKEVVEKMENESLEVNNEEGFEFEGELRVAQVGEQVTGKIARVTADEVFVDIGSKTEAILPAEEVYLEDNKSLTDLFVPEESIEVTVLDVDDQEGKITVSHKRLARDSRLNELEAAMTDEKIITGRVKQVIPAGLIIDLGHGIDGFMPGSLVDVRYIPDFNEFQNREIEFKVQEYDKEKGKLILSRKKVVEEENNRKKEEIFNTLEAGSTISGVIKRLTNFGAFVDIGGIDGLIHISELSWERVGHPSEVLKVGEEVEVKVIEIIPEKDRISLSLRHTQTDPWTKAVEELENGQIVTGKVTRLVNFGAFIEIMPGVEGLAHISQLADFHVNNPAEVLAEGENVEVKILEIKPKSKRISLSIKEAGGISVSMEGISGNGMDEGNVTLGDVFGDLFDEGDFKKNDKDNETEPGEEKIPEGE
ncbi:MAG: bifunctional 4-hydroxy-3-methylbut-2-enyl diphosphate reductase/30S ribosomal protein S1 [Bacillota bacterium]|nr:bifunctional 4-hydroxy-3-methylbut-2-enyl diphosphate reductase/30S ribosomal protein S1 [Bacillota bacterium]